MTQQDSAPQSRSPQDVRYSPYVIAEAVGDFPPTEQQAAVIAVSYTHLTLPTILLV